ncbi:MAG: hypothetical protein AAGA45_00030 [Verrucomicrobiota bacterium]
MSEPSHSEDAQERAIADALERLGEHHDYVILITQNGDDAPTYRIAGGSTWQAPTTLESVQAQIRAYLQLDDLDESEWEESPGDGDDWKQG